MAVIDSDFESIIPPHGEEDQRRLERSLLADGFHDWEPIVTWEGVIVDGHMRYRACKKLGIEFTTTEMEFESRDAAKIWILERHIKREDISSGQKAVLALDIRDAETREMVRKGESKASKGKYAHVLSDRFGVAHSTVSNVAQVKKRNADLYERLRRGEVSASAAYGAVRVKKENGGQGSAEFTADGRRICKRCHLPIDEGDQCVYNVGLHKRCWSAEKSERYKDVDRSLRENVPTYTVKSLASELRVSAEGMRKAMYESIAINEQMGVSLTKRQRYDLDRSITSVLNAICKIG